MTGLVYKEWKQNRWYILSMIVCGFAPLMVLLIMHDEIKDMGDKPIRIGGLIAGFLAAGALQMLVLRGDDRKLWGYWITATPDGYKGFLRVKYEMIFGMILLLMFSVQFVDMGYQAVAADMEKEEVGQISGIALPLCFVQIILRAIDIPFVYRFGSKRGSFVKLTCFVAVALSFSALFVIYQEKFDPFFEMGIGVFTTENRSLLLSVGLVVSLALYYLSYRITCKLYLKGVEQYDH